ncbi:VUT family protein [Mesorhizobium sp.]|uniref:VUT family protein n=1 Tax=Mesorhizobium sp. TaxID=1871066 RepID=UPI00345940DA
MRYPCAAGHPGAARSSACGAVVRAARSRSGGRSVSFGSRRRLTDGAIAALIASPVLAVASVAAFLVAEMVAPLVFTGLCRRGLVLASVASSVLGLLLDSLIFVQIAFGNPAYRYQDEEGQTPEGPGHCSLAMRWNVHILCV